MMPGGPEILIVLGVVLLLFGAKRIPELARSLGSGARQFRQGLSGENEDSEEEQVKELAGGEERGATQDTSVSEDGRG